MSTSNPLFGLYAAAEHHYDRLLEALPRRKETQFLYILPEFHQSYPFVDPASSFKADTAVFTDIEKRAPGVYTLGLNFLRGSCWYARNRHAFPPEVDESQNEGHAVVVARDGPPVLLHIDRFYRTNSDDTYLLPAYLASGIAEVPSLERTMHLHTALASVAPQHIEEDWL